MCLSICQAFQHERQEKEVVGELKGRPSAHFQPKSQPLRHCQETCYRLSRAIQETLSRPSSHHSLLLVDAATRLILLVCTHSQTLWAQLRHLLIARLESLHSLRVSCLPHGCFLSKRLDSRNPGANNIVAPSTFPPCLMHCTAHRHPVKPVIALHRDAYKSLDFLFYGSEPRPYAYNVLSISLQFSLMITPHVGSFAPSPIRDINLFYTLTL